MGDIPRVLLIDPSLPEPLPPVMGVESVRQVAFLAAEPPVAESVATLASIATPGPVHAVLMASAAVGVFLLGMVMMTDGLKQLGGSLLRELLARFTTNRLRGLATGFGLTVAMQASSSTVLATMGFVAAGMISLTQAVAVVAGATVGSTSTSWLMATVGLKASIAAFAGPLVLIGALLRMLRRGRVAQWGLLIAGFGLIIVGIASLKDSLAGVITLVQLDRIDASSAAGTSILVVIGAILAASMQSSAAPVALAMASLADGSLTFTQAAPLVVGASVGTTSTALIALPTVNVPGRRVGIVWIASSVIAAAVALALLPFLEQQAIGLTRFLSATDPIALAAFHSSFAFLGALVVVLICRPLAERVERWIPDREPSLTVHLEPRLAGVPSIGLESARRSLVLASIEVLREARRQLADAIGEAPVRLERVKDAESVIEHFLGSLRSDSLSGADAERQVACLQALDHVRDIRRSLKRFELAADGRLAEGLEDFRSEAFGLTVRIMHWLAGETDAESPIDHGLAFARRIHAARPRLRQAILGQTLTRGIDPVVADRSLDMLRAIDEYAREVSRLAANLDMTRTKDQEVDDAGDEEPKAS